MALSDTVPFVKGRWSLDEASGTRATSVGTDALSDNGSVGSAAGKLGDCATFDGTTQWLSAADSADLDASGGDWSFACWVYLTNNASVYIVAGKWDDGVDGEWRLYHSGSTFYFTAQVFDGGSAPQAAASTFGFPAINTWHHVVVRWKASTTTLSISVNGSANTDANAAAVQAHATAKAFTLGAGHGGGVKMPGRLDEAVWWQGYCLTDAEVDEHYNAGAGVAYPDWAGGGGGGNRRRRLLLGGVR